MLDYNFDAAMFKKVASKRIAAWGEADCMPISLRVFEAIRSTKTILIEVCILLNKYDKKSIVGFFFSMVICSAFSM